MIIQIEIAEGQDTTNAIEAYKRMGFVYDAQSVDTEADQCKCFIANQLIYAIKSQIKDYLMTQIAEPGVTEVQE